MELRCSLWLWISATLLQLAGMHLDSVTGNAIQLIQSNYNEIVHTKEIMLVNFYADWCRFSQQLKPIFDKAADLVQKESPNRAVLGRVDCEAEKQFCNSMFHISKYPTLKVIRNGQIVKKEYRGQRSTDALVEFIRQQLSDPVHMIQHHELSQQEVKRAIVGYFPDHSSLDYDTFKKAAISLRDECPFYAILGQGDKSQITYRKEGSPDIVYTGSMDFLTSFHWMREQCVPLVREITFQNGEEMTEEGLPLLICFYHPDEPEIKDLFVESVKVELDELKGTINPVTADGILFAHPLHHIGKHKADLPVLTIDSFRHMYVFPNFEDIKVPGKLKQFVLDLHSGKLHKDFHNPTKVTVEQTEMHRNDKRDTAEQEDPPESTFKKLRPARSRYSLLRDEL